MKKNKDVIYYNHIPKDGYMRDFGLDWIVLLNSHTFVKLYEKLPKYIQSKFNYDKYFFYKEDNTYKQFVLVKILDEKLYFLSKIKHGI